MQSTYAAGTHLGRRENNEDSYVCDAEHGLWLVADGVGGLSLGEVASAISAYTLKTMIANGHGVHQAIETAHQRIQEYGKEHGSNLGTALVLLLSPGSLYNIFWAGDCRAYLFDGSLNLITHDHSHLQFLLDSGDVSEEEAAADPRKKGLTKVLGIQELETVRPDTISDRWKPEQKILLCSDGLSGCVSDEDIQQILRMEGTDQDRVDSLIEKALIEGGQDNITAILVSPPPSALEPTDDDTAVPDDL